MIRSGIFFEQLRVGSYRNFCYLAADECSKKAVIFDPAWEIESLYSRLRQADYELVYIINTHAHFDHIEGNDKLREKTGARVIMHESALAKKDIGVKDLQEMIVGDELNLKFFHTPGHSPESMCIKVGGFGLVTGDTLFIGECGRVDLPGGDPSALYDSFNKLRLLEESLVVYPGHDYGSTPNSTLGEQIKTNYTLAARTREEFIDFMMNE